MTHPLLPRFINLASERGFKSIITTNGTLLKQRSEELLSVNIHKINISLHSFEKSNDEFHAQYIRDIADFAKKAANKGTIVVFRLWNKGYDDGRNNTTLSLLKENMAGEWIENSRGIKIRENIYLEFGERFEWPDKNAEIRGNKYFCYGLKDQFGILSDGTVVPCCLDSDGIINLGNIFIDDLDSVLKSERAKSIVDSFGYGKAAEDLCKRCGYAQRFV
ncbi:MAG: SPASM domain-containing protein [Clostridia bacterium]|nr:SPASM domain-containing protein [Clostridia bacterium]